MSLRKGVSADNPYLELVIYRNRLQLVTTDVLYSDGDKYIPAVVVSRHFKAELASFKNVLVLGTGLGSIVHVLHKKKARPAYTLVERDEVVLEWAMEVFDTTIGSAGIEPVCADAQEFLQSHKRKYDLLFIDVFNGRHVPSFVISDDFLKQCKDHLTAGGHLAMNYIVNDESEWGQLQKLFSDIFPGYKAISRSVNKILVV